MLSLAENAFDLGKTTRRKRHKMAAPALQRSIKASGGGDVAGTFSSAAAWEFWDRSSQNFAPKPSDGTHDPSYSFLSLFCPVVRPWPENQPCPIACSPCWPR